MSGRNINKQSSFGNLPSGKKFKSKSLNPVQRMKDSFWGKKEKDTSFLDDPRLTKLEKDFLAALHHLEDIKKHLVGDQWLTTYALYKQATEGDCKQKKPSKMFKTKFLKYEYWYARKGMPTDAAAKRYILVVKEYSDKIEAKAAGKDKIVTKKTVRQPRKYKALKNREPTYPEDLRGSVVPLSIDDAPPGFDENITYATPGLLMNNRAHTSVDLNKLFSVRLNSSVLDDETFANFNSAKGSFIQPPTNKRSTIIFKKQNQNRQSVRGKFVPTEAEFKRFTIVRNSTAFTTTTMVSFNRPTLVYVGSTLEELVEQGKREGCPYKSSSVNVNAKVNIGYTEMLPVIHKMYVEINKEVENAPLDVPQSDLSKEEILEVPLDKYMFRLVRYLDRWFENEASLNSAGCRSMIISIIYIEKKLKTNIDNFQLNKLNIYNVLAVCMLLAAKYCEDCLIATSYWAQVCGMTVEDLLKGEGLILKSASYDLYVNNEDFNKVARNYELMNAPKTGKKQSTTRVDNVEV